MVRGYRGAKKEHHALEKVLVEEEGTPGLVPGSSCQRFMHRRRAFMKKLLTVLSSRPSCCEMVICISLEGRLFSLKMAIRVRRWRSVKTSRCFLGCRLRSFCCSCSLRLQATHSKERTWPLIGAGSHYSVLLSPGSTTKPGLLLPASLSFIVPGFLPSSLCHLSTLFSSPPLYYFLFKRDSRCFHHLAEKCQGEDKPCK